MTEATATNPFARKNAGTGPAPMFAPSQTATVEPEGDDEELEFDDEDETEEPEVTPEPEPTPEPTPEPVQAQEEPKPKRQRRKTAAATSEAPAPANAPMPMPGAAASSGLPTIGGTASPNGGTATNGAPLPNMAQHNPYGGENAGELDDDFEIDLTNVQAGGRDYITPGKHLMYCSGFSQGTSKTGNRKITLSYVIASGDNEGKKTQADLALTELAMWKVDEHARALGITNDDNRKVKLGEIKTKALNRLVIGEFADDQYNGRKTSNLVRVSPTDEIGMPAGTTLEQARRGEY